MGRIPFRSPVKISSFRWIPPISNIALSTVFELIWRRGCAFVHPPAGESLFLASRTPSLAPMKGGTPPSSPPVQIPLVVGANSR